MRAQFFSRHNPTPERMPQTAGNMYMSEIAMKNTLKRIGEPGNWFARGTGAKTITANIKIPITNVSADPSSDRIAITVTPTERFMAIPLVLQS